MAAKSHARSAVDPTTIQTNPLFNFSTSVTSRGVPGDEKAAIPLRDIFYYQINIIAIKN